MPGGIWMNSAHTQRSGTHCCHRRQWTWLPALSPPSPGYKRSGRSKVSPSSLITLFSCFPTTPPRRWEKHLKKTVKKRGHYFCGLHEAYLCVLLRCLVSYCLGSRMGVWCRNSSIREIENRGKKNKVEKAPTELPIWGTGSYLILNLP